MASRRWTRSASSSSERVREHRLTRRELSLLLNLTGGRILHTQRCHLKRTTIESLLLETFESSFKANHQEDCLPSATVKCFLSNDHPCSHRSKNTPGTIRFVPFRCAHTHTHVCSLFACINQSSSSLSRGLEKKEEKKKKG